MSIISRIKTKINPNAESPIPVIEDQTRGLNETSV